MCLSILVGTCQENNLPVVVPFGGIGKGDVKAPPHSKRNNTRMRSIPIFSCRSWEKLLHVTTT